MKKIILFTALVLMVSTLTVYAQSVQYFQTGEEFSGPFKSWKNVKTDFGAKGDGTTDDAPAINAALVAMKNYAKDSFNVLYFPAGTYLINDSLYNPGNGYDGLAIIGEDPATTIISWNGSSTCSGMFSLTGWYLRVCRLTFEGNNKAMRGIYKLGGFSTHNEFSDLVFKDFKAGIGLDLAGTNQGQAENAIFRCSFLNCASGIASCNWNSLDQWVWYCLFEDCNLAINQCIGYFQIYNNVFIRSKTYDIGSSPYKNVIANNTSINSKCFFAGSGAYIRGNKIYSNVDSFYTKAGTNTVMLDNLIRTTRDSMAVVRVGNANMFAGNTFSSLNSKWKKWPFQPPFDPRDHGMGAGALINKQIEKCIDGNSATSFETDVAPFGIKWNCPVGTQRTAVKYTVSAPLSTGGTSPYNFQLLGSNDWGYSWDILDVERAQNFTGGANPVNYPLKNKTAYSMYELLALNSWLNSTSGGRSIVNTGAQTGTYCEQIVLPAFAVPRNVYQSIPVNHDTSYVASGWMKSNAVNTAGYFIVFWYSTPSPAPFVSGLAAGYIKADTIGTITGTTAWTNYSKTITAPANALSAIFYLNGFATPTSTGTIWFDTFSFSSTKTPATNILLDPGFEAGQNPQGFEVNEFTLLDSLGSDLTKDPNGFISGADESWGHFYSMSNKVVDTTAIAYPSTLPLPGTPQNLSRKIFEVVRSTGNDANAIQTQINLAALEAYGTKPVVHVPFGQYNIKTTITVPAGSDMQIVGDGLGTGATTTLVWAAPKAASGPLLSCQGPSRITIKDLLLNVPYNTYTGPEALVIEDADQVGGRIYGNQVNFGGQDWTRQCDIGTWVDGVENSDITMVCWLPGAAMTGMIKADGGSVLSSGGNTNGQISLFGGATGDDQNLFNVSNGGKIEAEGMWNEGDWARTSGLLNLSNTTGQVSVICMSWNLLTNAAYPMINTDNFNGNLTLLLNHLNNSPQTFVPLTGDGSKLNVLSAYNDFGQSATLGSTADSTWQDQTSPAANSAFISNIGTKNGYNLDDVVSKVHNVRPDTTSLLNSLAQLRAARNDPPTDRTAGVTDVKLFRVGAWGTQGHAAVHFNGSSVSTGLGGMPEKKNSFVLLYPTVVNQNYTVSYLLAQGGSSLFTVFDIYGKRISELKTEDSEGNHQLSFSADGLSSGIYFLKFQSGTVTETKKFIVTK